MNCISCKGRGLCGKRFCPIYSKAESMFKAIDVKDKEEINAFTPPSVFIGSRLKYPEVNVGILSPPSETKRPWLYDAQHYWAHENYTINDIAALRSNLINSRFKTTVKDVRIGGKFIEMSQEVGMALKPVDIEIELVKKLKFKFKLDDVHLPMGPTGELKKLKVGNARIDTKVEKVYSDIDLKAAEAIRYLSKFSYDESKLTQLLSIGVLGLKKNRVFVPTRNSITAVDDILGKEIIKRMRDYKVLEDYMFFSGSYLGNYYFIMLFPEIYSYELFEIYIKGSVWNPTNENVIVSDNEGYRGRSSYVANTAGGYYAARLPVLEYLDKIKRQASILVIRFETPEYYLPLGVFVVREAARKSMIHSEKLLNRNDLLMLAKQKIYDKFKFNVDELFSKSKIIEKIKNQVKLTDFFNP